MVVHALIVRVFAPRVTTRTVVGPAVSSPLGFGAMSYDASGMLSDPLDPNAPRAQAATIPSSSPAAVWSWRIERPASSAPSCRSLPHDSCCATATARTTPSATPTGRYEPTSTTRVCPASSSCPRPNPRAEDHRQRIDRCRRCSRPSRPRQPIWVEGIHDAELIEKVWGGPSRRGRGCRTTRGRRRSRRAGTRLSPG